MPELPEVETIRRQLDKELKGYSFVSVKTDWEKSFLTTLFRHSLKKREDNSSLAAYWFSKKRKKC